MTWMTARGLPALALACAMAPLQAADTRVDLRKEQVGKPPAAFEKALERNDLRGRVVEHD